MSKKSQSQQMTPGPMDTRPCASPICQRGVVEVSSRSKCPRRAGIWYPEEATNSWRSSSGVNASTAAAGSVVRRAAAAATATTKPARKTGGTTATTRKYRTA